MSDDAREPAVGASWEAAFVAVSAALGEPHDDALLALGDAGALRAGPIASALRDSRKAARARALARALADVARAIEQAELA